MSLQSAFKNILGIKSDLVAADTESLRRSIANPEQRERTSAITAELNEARQYDEDFELPSNRERCVLWHFGVKSLAEVSAKERLFAELAAHVYTAPEVKHFSEVLHERRRVAARKAAQLVSEIRHEYIPQLESEIGRYRSALVELFEQYEVEDSVDSAGPLKRMKAEHAAHAERDPDRIGTGNLGDGVAELLARYV